MIKIQLWQKVLLALFLGSVLGYFLEPESFLIAEVLDTINQVFIRALKMVVVPLVFFAVLYGVTSIEDTETFGRLGKKAVTIYLTTTTVAITSGLTLATLFKPGVGMNIDLYDSTMSASQAANSTLKEIIINVVPSNPIEAMAQGNTLQIVVFAFFCGFSLILIQERGRMIREFIVSATNLAFKMVALVIKFTPYGVFAIMACTISRYGIGIVSGLSKFIFVILLALVIHYCFLGFIMFVVGKLSPFPFYKKMTLTQSLAFSTSSTKATLPTAISELRSKMGVSKTSSSFILPLGAAMNMDATAIYLGISTVFFAQITGTVLDWSQYVIVAVTATVGSIGAAGFPGGGMVMMGMVLSSIGLPITGIPLIIGIDRVLEMARTLINITGDCAVTVVVDNLENTLDKKVYYSKSQDLKKTVNVEKSL